MEPHTSIALSFKCPKQLNQLHPVNGDYYCDGCQKTVHDFRGMTEAQVLEAMSKSARQTCGIFEKERITVLPQIPRWLKWASAAMVALGMASCQESAHGKIGIVEDNTTTQERPRSEVATLGIPRAMPTFAGGEKGLKRYFQKHLKNPKRITGRAYVTFDVEPDGSLSNIHVVKSPDSSMNANIVKTIKNMPRWTPVKENGRSLKTRFTLPITFSDK